MFKKKGTKISFNLTRSKSERPDESERPMEAKRQLSWRGHKQAKKLRVAKNSVLAREKWRVVRHHLPRIVEYGRMDRGPEVD